MNVPDPARLLAIFCGAGLGGLLRYGLVAAVPARAAGVFPLGTLCINLAGCLAIGLFFGLRDRAPLAENPALWYFLTTGLCGGFTTMSAFSQETFNLLRERDYWEALLNAGFTLAGCLAATAAGFLAVKQLS